jgi:predicted GIY-YIG superfamily endonuclease
MAFFTYMVASKRNGTLYIGHTDDLIHRVSEHREHIIPGLPTAITSRALFGTKHMTPAKGHSGASGD